MQQNDLSDHKLTLTSDVDCAFYLDGEEKLHLKANSPKHLFLPSGIYLIKFVRDDSPLDMLWLSFNMPSTDCHYHAQLLASTNSPVYIDNDDTQNSEQDGFVQRTIIKIRQNQEARKAYRQAEMKKMAEVVKTVEEEAARLSKLNEIKEKEKKVQQMVDEELLLIKKYFDNGLFSEAFQLVKRNVEKGNADAKYYLGMFYEQGKGGVKQNLQTALKYYKQSAEQGNKDAQKAISRLEDTLNQ